MKDLPKKVPLPALGRKRARLQAAALTALLALAAGLLHAQPLNFAWAKQIGGPAAQLPNAIVTDSDENIYVSGTFNGTCDMDPGPGTHVLTCTGTDDCFLSKYDRFGNLLWAAQWSSGGGAPKFYSMAVDADDNLYLTGYLVATCDFDPDPIGSTTLTSAGIWDILVLKLDSAGNFLWAKRMGSTDYDVGNGIVADDAGNAYVTGHFNGTVDFNPGTGTFNLTASPSNSSFVLKLDASGNFVWAKKLGGIDQSRAYGIGLDSLGNVVSIGYFTGTADFDPGPGTYSLNAATTSDIYVSKLTPAGNFIWARQIGGSGSGGAKDLAIDDDSNLLIVGEFSGIMDFDPGAGVYNLASGGTDADAFTCKLDFSGNFVWAKRYGGGSQDVWGEKIAVDAAGNSYTMGFFYYFGDFDPGPGSTILTTHGGTDIFCVALDAAGNLIQTYQYGSVVNDFNGDITASAMGNVYSTGLFPATMDVDPTPAQLNFSSLGGADIFLQKLSICPPTTASLSDTACGSYVYEGNAFTQSAVIIKTLPNTAGCDSVVTMALTIGGADSTLTITACDSLSLNGQAYVASGTYTQTLTDHLGCDSILTLHLSLTASTDSTQAVTACGSYSANGQTYTLPGTYTQLLTNAAGCDSLLTIALSLSQATDSTLHVHGCNSYSLNGQTYAQQGIHTQTLVNAAGCDSTLTLYLTLDFANYGISQVSGVLSSLQANAAYQWVDCNNAFAPIPGATGQQYIPAVPGSYAVVVTKGACSDTSSCAAVTVVGISHPQTPSVTVSPSPVHDVLRIALHLPAQGAVTATLATLSGTEVMTVLDTGVLDGGDHAFTVPMQAIPSGMYFLQLRHGDGLETAKVLVQH